MLETMLRDQGSQQVGAGICNKSTLAHGPMAVRCSACFLCWMLQLAWALVECAPPSCSMQAAALKDAQAKAEASARQVGQPGMSGHAAALHHSMAPCTSQHSSTTQRDATPPNATRHLNNPCNTLGS